MSAEYASGMELSARRSDLEGREPLGELTDHDKSLNNSSIWEQNHTSSSDNPASAEAEVAVPIVQKKALQKMNMRPKLSLEQLALNIVGGVKSYKLPINFSQVIRIWNSWLQCRVNAYNIVVRLYSEMLR